jgi:hypothetical protein
MGLDAVNLARASGVIACHAAILACMAALWVILPNGPPWNFIFRGSVLPPIDCSPPLAAT